MDIDQPPSVQNRLQAFGGGAQQQPRQQSAFTPRTAPQGTPDASQQAGGFKSVRDRISSYATESATRAAADSHHPAPRRLSQGARAAPYPRKPSISGGHPSASSQPAPHSSAMADAGTDADGDAAMSQSQSLQKDANKQAGSSSNDQLAAKFSAASASGSNKCQSCGKTVYAMEQVTLDNHVFHRACFKCTHCKGQLKMGNLASMDGKYYCKPHFKQLFALKGNYSEGFGKEEPKRAWLQEHGGAQPKTN